MMNLPKLCSKSYQAGLRKRRTIGANAGSLYKINHMREQIQSYQEELYNVGLCVATNDPYMYSLRHCTKADKCYWTRNLPFLICFNLGYKVVGTLCGLQKDGVPNNVIRDIKNYSYSLMEPVFFDNADAAYREIKQDWGNVKNDFINESTLLNYLLWDVEFYIDTLILWVDDHERYQ